MSIYRKDETGVVKKVATPIIQRWNDRIFTTTRSAELVNGVMSTVYDIDPSANKYISGLSNYTEFQLYFGQANNYSTVYVRFNNRMLLLKRSYAASQPIAINTLRYRTTCYTLDTSSNEIWTDYSTDMTLVNNEITQIKDGTIIVKKAEKAEQDKNGNDIVNTYETKLVVSGIDSRVTSLESSKLNKDFTSLIEEVSLTLSDVFVVDKGSGARKVNLGTLASYLSTQELELFTIVAELPTENQNPNTIYLLATESEDGGNQLLEYIWIENESRWELIGTVGVDLSNYNTKAEVSGLLEDKVDKIAGKGLSTNDYTNTDKQSVEKISTIEQDILDLESNKVDKNNAITAGTKTKITYDEKGLVTAGDDLTESDIPPLSPSKITQDANNRFVTDDEKSTWNEKQNALTPGDGISISGNVISATNEGYLPDEETITLNGNNELEATNVAIWRYE